MTITSYFLRLAAAAGMLSAAFSASAAEKSVMLAATTSTDNSGLLAYLLPIFEAKTGIKVHVLTVGTGQALRAARNGDVDVVLVHDRASELKFVAEGYGVERREVMYNYFILVGPRDDPAGINGLKDAVAAFRKIARARAAFVSRGDDSGTHKAERRLWKAAGVDPAARPNKWHREAGSGMGATLNIAAAMSAYALSDRGTWMSFRNRRTLTVLVQGDQRLFNQYGIILVNPRKHAHVKHTEARALADWITSAEGQQAIGAFTIDGRQPFIPNHRGGG